MKNKFGNVKCDGCGGYNIAMKVGFDGMDSNSEAGEGSGFKWCVKLFCNDCGRIYPICRVKQYSDVSPLKVRLQ